MHCTPFLKNEAFVQALALHGALVTLTDLPVCLELMRYNVALNFEDRLKGERGDCMLHMFTCTIKLEKHPAMCCCCSEPTRVCGRMLLS
jgi:hypothetical protein